MRGAARAEGKRYGNSNWNVRQETNEDGGVKKETMKHYDNYLTVKINMPSLQLQYILVPHKKRNISYQKNMTFSLLKVFRVFCP